MSATTICERPVVFTAAEVRATLAGRKTQFRRAIDPQPNNPETFGISPIWGWGVPIGMDRFCVHAAFNEDGKRVDRWLPCPFGQPGDRLWVRETWCTHEDPHTMVDGILYRADDAFVPIDNTQEAAERWMDAAHLKARPKDMAEVRPGLLVGTARKAKGWRPSTCMPRWASRLTLEIKDVRVQRLQEIGEKEARAEGVDEWIASKDGRAYDIAEKSWCRFARSIDSDAGVAMLRGLFAAWWDATHGRRPGRSWDSNPWIWVITFSRVEPSTS